ncbi:enolase C-terminal domain-like protein [Fontisphaera persica]|uniref:enolase C-terminal domain-like protein n=1 Tax=Fontisphaera persica TaxID=2974023 RepID=UPI0024C008B4|nr:enolase C-terminal domain-like protein [Fontisphaera persica]WCJ60088.1 enolase C-terminal domain-like protein [Fontisphaera persica]
MPKATDIRVVGAAVYWLPVHTRVPLKFGPETLTSVTCVRVKVRVMDRCGRRAEGWGETPLSVQWVWPSAMPYAGRHHQLKNFCVRLAAAWADFDAWGHPLEIGHDFQAQILPSLLALHNEGQSEPMPWLAALVACSAFDLAVHDAFGCLLQKPVYHLYTADFLNRDLAHFLEPAEDLAPATFRGRYPADFLTPAPPRSLLAWHLVGGLDKLDPAELTEDDPQDGYPVLLADWIQRDGLQCLKIKLRGNDAAWDYQRLVRVGELACQHGVAHLSADFNCTVTDPAYVNEILDRLRAEHPALFDLLLYVEQPFPYDLEAHRLDVHSVAARKPLFLDESAHDWKLVRLGRSLGWNGVALKTCKTQTGAILSACWARTHGLQLMVQDLTNPMLAQIPHVQLAAHVGTIAGVETNAMQFYPAASLPEAAVHPGLYQRRLGRVDWSTVQGPGFGYRLAEIQRTLPPPACECGI